MEAVVAEIGRKSRRPQVGAFLVLAGLLTSMLALLAPNPAAAEPLNPGTLGNFENEGDQDDPTLNTGTIDWETVKTDPRITQWALLHDDGDTDTNDVTWIDSAKEQDPSTWGCAANESPPKDDIFRLYLASQISQSAQYLHIGYVRATGTGDTDINVEFNRATGDFSCPGNEGRVRSRDDLMISFTFGGGADSSVIEVFRWDPTAASDGAGDPAPGDPGQGGNDFVAGDGHWDKVALAPNVANGSDNAVFNGGNKEGDLPKITDQFFDDGVLEPRTFGELTLDLGSLFGSGLLGCPGLGFVNVHSRASHDFASDLKEVFPEAQFDLSNCAKIKIKKVDNSQPPVAQEGAVYGLYDSLAKAQAVAGQTDAAAKAAAVSWCTTGADGTCLLTNVDPAKDYWITEITPPAGLLPSTEIEAVDDSEIEPFATLDLSSDPFVNDVPVGSVEITKRLFDDKNGNGDLDAGEQITPDQMSDLDGIKFELQQAGVTAKTHPADANAECTITGGTGKCTISNVRFGTYDIKETLNPSGPSGISVGDPPSPVTIDENGETVTRNYDNPLSPINITLDKAGPDTANVGDQITYRFDVSTTGVPLTITELSEVIDPANHFDDRCDAGTPLTGPDKSTAIDSSNDSDSRLEAGETWRWTCQHVVTLADATDGDGTDLLNKAHVEGKDDVGREVEDDDTHTVVILLPDLGVTKLAADGVDDGGAASGDETIDAPGTASYTIVVTNHGTGNAQNATLTDTLPAGSWTVSLASPDGDDVCPTGGNPKSGSFTCTFGTLAPGASKTVTVSRPVTIANDCAAVLVNNAGVATTYQQGDLDPNSTNDAASATVRVRCPDVGVVKTATNTPISAGERAEWTITLTNNGAGVANDVFLVDEIPADLTDLQLGGANAADCALDGHALTCDFGDLPPNDGAPGGADTRVITVSGLTDAADCGTVPNTASVASDEEGTAYEDSNSSNNSSSADVVVECPDVWVEKTGPASVNATDTITWTVTFGNEGDGTAFDVVLTDDLPSDLTGYQLGGPDAELCEITGGDVVCTIDEMAPDAKFEITITGTTDPADCPAVTNPVEIEASNEASEDEGDNSDEFTTDVLCPDVDLEKVADDPSTVSAGDPIGFTITVTNSGDGVAYDVDVADPLPSGDGVDWSIESQSGGAGCAIEGDPPTQTLTCGGEGFDLDPEASFTVHIVSDTDPTTDDCVGGVLDNTATLTLTNGVEEDLSNNSDSAEVLCPGLNLGKVADAPLVEAGDDLGFTITVTNLDDGEPPAEGVAKGVVVEDQLPGDLAWEVADDSDLPDGATCDIDEDNLLTCELGDLEAVDAEGAPQVTIHVVAPTDEGDCTTYDNTATATVDNGADPDPADASSRVRCPIEVDLDKTGDEIAHVGDTVDYEFTVTNVGGEDLVDVELTDPECNDGTITLVDDGDGDDTLAAGTWDGDSFEGGEVWSYTCQRTITEDDVVEVDGQDFALNTGTVTAEDEDGRPVDDEDPHEVLIITPDIEIVKTVDDETPGVGQTVTYTYVVTNTGNTTLFGVDVTDDILGDIGTIDQLEPGGSATLTKTMVVAEDSPTRNVATADGEDVLGKHVDDDDDAEITIVLGNVVVPRAPLPRTGMDIDHLLGVAGGLLILGGALLLTGGPVPATLRRRRR